MPIKRTVAIYGNTLALAGIALALERHPAWHVVTLDLDANLAQQLRACSPNAIIFDQSQTDAQTLLTNAGPRRDLVAIGIEANSDQMLLWSGHLARALTIQDLAHAIDALPDSIQPSSRRVSIGDQARRLLPRWTTLRLHRSQKLAIAVSLIGVCVVLLLTLAQPLDNPTAPLFGTALGSGISPEMGIAFGVGIVIGGALIGLWVRFGRHR